MKKDTKYFSIVLITCTLILGLFYSCSDDDGGSDEPTTQAKFLINEIKITGISMPDLEEFGQIYEYEYDENNVLVKISNRNLQYPNLTVDVTLIYDQNNNLSQLREERNGGVLRIIDVTIESGKISFYNYYSTSIHYYYNENRLITRIEDIYISKTNNMFFRHNNSSQIDYIDSDSVGQLYKLGNYEGYDETDPFQFYLYMVSPIREFIVMYVFDLKFNGLGKPSSFIDGELLYTTNYGYEYNSQNQVSKFTKEDIFDGYTEELTEYNFKFTKID